MAYRKQPATRRQKMAGHQTGTHDVTYNLVSILYHALQGAEIYGKYAEDAEQSGDSEFKDFFAEIQEEEKRRADRVKELLAKRLGQEGIFSEEKGFRQEEKRGSKEAFLEE